MPQTTTLFTLALMALVSYKSTTKLNAQTLPPPAPPLPDSNVIKTLLPVENTYQKHFWVDLNDDADQELMIVSKSAKRSKCLSGPDTNCHFLDIFFYTSGPNRPEVMSKHSLPHFTKTEVTFDSLQRILVTTRIEPTGHSVEEKTEVYKIRHGRFYLEQVFLSVNTKISSAFGHDADNWQYVGDMTTGQLEVKYSQIRLDTTAEHDNFDIKDTLHKFTFPVNPNIHLGTEYNLDSIFGEENLIHFY